MAFLRTFIAAVAAIALATPVFADDTTATTTTQTTETTTTAPATTDTNSLQTTSTETTTTTTTTETKINVNKASAKDLMKIKGINASKARAIVAYRKKHGDFKTLDDLINVKGFKKVNPETMKEIQDQLVVE